MLSVKTKTSLNTIGNIASLAESGRSFTRKYAVMKWNGYTSFDGNQMWTDGTNIYYAQYVLNGDTWEEKTWGGYTSFTGNQIWSDGENIYYSYESKQYVLNGSTWEAKTWSGLTTFYGEEIWSDGENIYYSNADTQYVLNKETSTWEAKTWSGLTTFYGEHIWTDGTNIYYSYGSAQYVLNGDTWEAKTWNGVTVGGFRIWTDGTNIYYSSASKQYVLNGSTWESISWNGISLYGEDIWTDGTNIYYSSDSNQYILLPTTARFYSKNSSGWGETQEAIDPPSGNLEINTNETYDITAYESVVVKVPTRIKVDELPTENIDFNSIYECNNRLYICKVRNDFLGSVTFNDEISLTERPSAEFDFTCTNDSGEVLEFCDTESLTHFDYGCLTMTYQLIGSSGVNYNMPVYTANEGWIVPYAQTINITKEPTDEEYIAWLKASTKLRFDWVEYSQPSGLPIEVATEAEMNAFLESAEVGSVYKYVGETTDTYENGVKYEVFEEVSE